VRIPECKLLTAMRRTERVVAVEHLEPVRLHRRVDLINQCSRERARPTSAAHSQND
jgi:hypothetical protein